jgi:ABC-2 type transport system permease protein
MSATTALRLTRVHARYQFLETVRIPIAVVGTTAFPALSLLFFVTTQPFAQDTEAATTAVAQLAVFSVMSVCLFSYGVGVAEDRAIPWDGYLRTLPAGPGPRLGGRVVNGLAFAVLGLLPLALIGWLLTAATLPLHRVPPTAVALLLAALPLFAAGLAIGYSLPAKAAIAVAQLLLLPLAVAGGLFFPPEMFPGWLDAVSRWLPTRAGRDTVVSVVTGGGLPAGALLALAVWSALLGALAVWAYRRDEGRRFS